MRFFRLKRTLAATLLVLFALPIGAFAATFTPGRLLTDAEFTDVYSYTATDIQNFLVRRGGALATKTFTHASGTKSAADFIFAFARTYGISPKVLLVTLQKEQSLLTSKEPTQRALDCAMGYEWGNGCQWMFDNKPGNKGFANQVESGAWQFRRYFDVSTNRFEPLQTHTLCFQDGTRCQEVFIENHATAALYNYTPYLSGNQRFFDMYSEWFGRQYPDGALLRVGKTGPTWLLQNGQRRAIQTRSAFMTRFGDYSKILSVSADVIASYPRGADIKLPNYSLVRTPDGHTYLLSGDEKRLIESDEVFRNLGFNPEEVEAVQTEDLSSYFDGVTISNTSAYPAGALVRIKENGAVVWIEQGTWYPILDRTILQSRFPNRKANITITSAELASYVRAEPLGFRDGELVRTKGESGVFVISHGQRRAIRSREIAKSFGYNLKNVIIITPRLAELHPLGVPLDVVQ